MTFVLRIDPVQVDRDFKTVERSNISSDTFNPMVTKLEDLGIDEKQNMIEPDIIVPEHGMYFYTPLLKEHKHQKALPSSTNIPCWHCTEPFTTQPIGIPIQYVSSYVQRYHISEKDGSRMYYQQDIHTKKQYEEVAKSGATIFHRDYFYVEGNFCSFYCMKAFVGLRKSEYQAKNVETLIKEMHFKMYGTYLDSCSAPDIRLLKKFGGHMSIYEFRSKEGRLYSRQLQHHYTTFDADKNETPSSQFVPCYVKFRYMGDKLN